MPTEIAATSGKAPELYSDCFAVRVSQIECMQHTSLNSPSNAGPISARCMATCRGQPDRCSSPVGISRTRIIAELVIEQ